MDKIVFYQINWQVVIKIQIGLIMISLVACTSSVPTITMTPLPSAMASPSATVASTPSFTPTTIQTITPKRVGECPTEQKALVPDFKKAFEGTGTRTQGLVAPVLNFLNQGGSQQAVVKAFRQAKQRIFEGDLTGDSKPELGILEPFLSVLGCINGKYEILFKPEPEWDWYYGWSEIASTQDMNLNGIPDLVVYNPNSCGLMWNCSEAYIYEWDGQQFQNIVENDYHGIITMHGPFNVGVKDIDGNGTQELITSGGIPTWISYYADGLPWREQSDIYMWNGKTFVLDYTEFVFPQYRFQAVQDGDRATLHGDYQKALEYYNQTIVDNQLEWWTPERQAYEEATHSFPDVVTPTPSPLPVPDPAERPHLAAYAQYRIMLLYIRQGMQTEAQEAYDILQKNFPNAKPGYIYTEMAAAFWAEYQSTSDIGQACSKAVMYAATHQSEILTYLGNTWENHYHGWQSLDYQPKDICPFSS